MLILLPFTHYNGIIGASSFWIVRSFWRWPLSMVSLGQSYLDGDPYRQVIFVDAVYCYAGLRSSSFIQSDGIFGGSSFWSVRSFWIWPLSIEQPVVSKHQRLWSVEMKCLLGLFSLMTITTLHHCQRIHIQRQIFRTTTSQHKVVSNLEKLP